MTQTPAKPRILVAPLDWGLGHTTRCIPLISELLRQGAEVILAGNTVQKHLLAQEFPQLTLLPLAGYEVSYARSGRGLLLRLLLQAPRITKAIRAEQAWLQKAVPAHGIHAVISDNRYGLYHPAIPSIFLTHQLRIKTPLGNWMENLLQKKNYTYIHRFTQCWVPDLEDEPGLAGELSHPVKLPARPLQYIGPLTRIKKKNTPPVKDHLFISLSGPEPQRSLLEEKIIEGVSHYGGTAVIVRGLPGEQRLLPSTNSIRFYNHIPAHLFEEEMSRAEFVIARSGYSTIMDLAALGQKCILVPTPGQTEQEYLADHLMQKRMACCVDQSSFSLQEALATARTFDYSFPFTTSSNDALEKAVSRLLQSLQ